MGGIVKIQRSEREGPKKFKMKTMENKWKKMETVMNQM